MGVFGTDNAIFSGFLDARRVQDDAGIAQNDAQKRTDDAK